MTTPAEAWQAMAAGNERFVAGAPDHPRQDADRRAEIAGGQTPQAALLGCSDSRLAAEIIFDLGLGDLFVVRNAGQVLGDSAIGSIEYAVGVLGVPLVVVLAHDECGAVRSAIDATAPGAAPLPAHVQGIVDRIAPSVRAAKASGDLSPEAVGTRHLRRTVAGLLEQSELVSDAVADGRLAVVGANYTLAEGRVVVDAAVGLPAA